MTHVDEVALVAACAYAGTEIEMLRSCIVKINEQYSELKKAGICSKNTFHSLWTAAITDHDVVDLFTFQAYKNALGKYYGLRKNTTATFPFVVEKATATEARIRVSTGVSMVFGALRYDGKLRSSEVTHRHNVIHTTKDVKESLVMHEAKKLACRAMNAKRKQTRRRRAA